MSAKDQKRVSKKEFIQRFARRGGIPLPVAQSAYDSMIDELIELVSQGNRVTLTGFGRFYPQQHKGHAVQLNFAEGAKEVSSISDYAVLKFSSTRRVNKIVSTEATVLMPRQSAEDPDPSL